MRKISNFQIAATHPFLELRKKGRKNSSGELFKISFVSKSKSFINVWLILQQQMYTEPQTSFENVT